MLTDFSLLTLLNYKVILQRGFPSGPYDSIHDTAAAQFNDCITHYANELLVSLRHNKLINAYLIVPLKYTTSGGVR